VIDAVWKKTRRAKGFALHRLDACGKPIFKDDYGKATISGWEIDHIIPVIEGGTDDLQNLQPLYWVTNRRKGDTYPWESSMLKDARR
jgi:hypothetical protein